MKTKLFPVFVIAAGLITLGARAQEVTSTTPAPAADPSAVPQASQVVYSPRLPSAAELTNVAAAQGLSIDKIVQTASQMTVVYRTANGQTNTVAYVLLPATGSVPGSTVATVATPTTPAPQVVYAAAPATQVVYYSAPGYYDPFYYPSYYGPWYGPAALSVGFGFGYHGGGGWRGGGFHGWHH
jgi:hypothetical protein